MSTTTSAAATLAIILSLILPVIFSIGSPIGINILFETFLKEINIFSPYTSGPLFAWKHNPMPYALNGPTWTIPYEFFCYVLL